MESENLIVQADDQILFGYGSRIPGDQILSDRTRSLQVPDFHATACTGATATSGNGSPTSSRSELNAAPAANRSSSSALGHTSTMVMPPSARGEQMWMSGFPVPAFGSLFMSASYFSSAFGSFTMNVATTFDMTLSFPSTTG